MSGITPFYFDREALFSLAESYSSAFRTADPFPHVVIDDFLPKDVIDAVIDEFPDPRAVDWDHYSGDHEEKLATSDEAKMGAFTRHLIGQFNAADVTAFLERLTGIDGLVPDPHLVGGGLHQIEPGGRLEVHADFNHHERLRLDRRLNLILYLNRDWREEWGGHLELWDRTMSRSVQKVLPVANRCVVFATTDHSFHGHPTPLACPPGVTRKSLAFYYYSNGRPAEEATAAHNTLFQHRRGEVVGATAAGRDGAWRSWRAAAARWVPPAISDRVRTRRR